MSRPTTQHRILVIGGGIAGASSARRLREHFGDAAEILVLDAAGRLGGRLRRVPFAGTSIEVGGTLVHSGNRLVVDAARDLGVELVDTRVDHVEGVVGGVSIWTGERFVLRAMGEGGPVWTAMAYQYGREGLAALHGLARTALDGFTALYDRIEAREHFADPAALIAAAGLGGLTTATFGEVALQAGASPVIVDELCAGVVRSLYNQEPDLLALPGCVALVGVGLAGGRAQRVREGNATLVRAMLASARAEGRTGSRVIGVDADRSVRLEDGRVLPADAVVIAAPLATSGIELEEGVAPSPVPYRRVHVTLVEGIPSPQHFGPEPATATILSTGTCAEFSSVGLVGCSPGTGLPILKIFSTTRVPDATVRRMVADPVAVRRLVWEAYPVARPDPESVPFELADGIFHPTVLEPFVSTIETEAIAGQVVADLVAARAGV
ncbi:FAD-dependent oxidoreductase [Brachybacterium sp. AOP25-B2-12]|uniref:FAD-dependent oxidoreductase n=1 Tax=Brachybacterium sp. AOP25-B2-12 TaxID=3457710 RepID=UPI0040333AC7